MKKRKKTQKKKSLDKKRYGADHSGASDSSLVHIILFSADVWFDYCI